MQLRNINGYTTSEIDQAVIGASGLVERKFRFSIYDENNQFIRETKNVISGFVQNISKQKIKGGGQATILKQDFTITDDYLPPNATDNEELELSALYTQIVNEAAVTYQRLGETSGTSAADSTGNGHTGTYTGGVTLNQRSLCEGALTNGAALFDGVNDYISIPHSTAFNVSKLSVEFWCKTTSTGTERIVERDVDNSNHCWVIFHTAGVLSFRIYISTVSVTLNSGVSINDGLQHHIVCTYDGAFMRVFVDGRQVAEQAQTGNLDSVTSGINISSFRAASNFFTGTIDEFALYGAALTSAQILARYQAGSNQLYEINFITQRLKVYAAIKMATVGTDGTYWAEFPIGVYRFVYSGSKTTATETVFDCQLQDLSSLLEAQKVSARYVVATNITYRAALTAVFTSAGFSASEFSITTSTVAEQNVATERVFPIGTSRLDILNGILAAMNYKALYFNENGIGICEPHVLTSTRAVDYTYTPNAKSIIVNEFSQSINLVDTVNQVTLAKLDAKGQVALTVTVVNNNRSHPTSVPSLGYTVPYYEVVDAADLTALTAKAERLLEDKSQISYELQIMTPINPFHGNEDIIRIPGLAPPPLFSAASALIPENFLETEWKIPFLDSGKMSHTLQFVYPI